MSRERSHYVLSVRTPELERALKGALDSGAAFTTDVIRRETVRMGTRDGTSLATDIYRPPLARAPVIAVRTPYGRAHQKFVDVFFTFACHGYVVVSQDCRGTGDSEPSSWDYYVYEREDSYELIDWIVKQEWCDGFIGACGGSYLAQTQWCMALHPRMSTIAPEVGGIGVVGHTARLHMFVNAYARSVGKGADKVPMSFDELERYILPETLTTGYFDEPLHKAFPAALIERLPQLRERSPADAKRWLWQHYTGLPAGERAELIKLAVAQECVTAEGVESLPSTFGQHVAHDAHSIAFASSTDFCRSLYAPALMITGWYDWFLHDALATWALLNREAPQRVRSGSRLVITPSAHNMPGYHEGHEEHPDLKRAHRTENFRGLLLRWYAAARNDDFESWPRVMYYLMGANEWYGASAWPPPRAKPIALYLDGNSGLGADPVVESGPDVYVYDPEHPTPTVGGSIISYVYRPGSVDVRETQERKDVLVYTTSPLEQDTDIVGPLQLILYASSSARDTDFTARLSDVFPDGRAIQLQSGMLRARYRNAGADPEFLEPGHVYRFEIDLWATANRFKAGHRIRLDISSADFPRFDRNTNRGGEPGPPVVAVQTVYHDAGRPSSLVVFVLNDEDAEA